MGRELLAEEPVFETVFARCDELLRKYGLPSIRDELMADESGSRLDDTEIAQPAIFALQVALATLWSSWGFEPRAVVGHSVGEIAAAHVAGGLSLEDAARVVAHRGRLMQAATGLGRMVSVALSQAGAAAAISGLEGCVSVAAVNAPESAVLSGETAALEGCVAALESRGVACRWLPVRYAFHSPQMAPYAAALRAELSDLSPRETTIPLFSTVTGERLRGEDLSADYWGRNVVEPVRFAKAVAAIADSGFDTFVEVGGHPVLARP